MKIKVVIAVFQNLPNMEKNGKPQPIIKSNEREEQKMCQKCNDSNCKDKCAKCEHSNPPKPQKSVGTSGTGSIGGAMVRAMIRAYENSQR